MSSGHLSCASCRIRVRADAREIGLLDGRCPICGEPLGAIAPASAVLGFRSFDLDAVSEHPPTKLPSGSGEAVDLAARRATAAAGDDFDADRWSDDGGAVNGAGGEVAGAALTGAGALA
jgi:hypothetical protein